MVLYFQQTGNRVEIAENIKPALRTVHINVYTSLQTPLVEFHKRSTTARVSLCGTKASHLKGYVPVL